MTIDKVLCHKILIEVRKNPNAGSGQFFEISVDGYNERTTADHIKYLFDKGLIKGEDNRPLASLLPRILIQDITPDGCRFLDEMEPEPPRRKIGF
ncbi:MAG: DUF2513 domain-containing protein [Bryobacteraceae bacterium]|jgi:hypothetical protein